MTEERITNALTGGQKGAKEEAYALLPVEPLAEVARVYGRGAKKYASRNWERGYDWSLSYSALQRHVNAFWGGQDQDPESGLHHLAHAVFHCLAMIEWGQTHPELDDRPTSEPESEGDYEAELRITDEGSYPYVGFCSACFYHQGHAPACPTKAPRTEGDEHPPHQGEARHWCDLPGCQPD